MSAGLSTGDLSLLTRLANLNEEYGVHYGVLNSHVRVQWALSRAREVDKE